VFIRDFDSTNGTFVNEEPVKGERELKNDDQLKIGPIMFTVRIEQTAPAPTAKSPISKTPLPPTKPATKVTPAATTSNDTPAPATKLAPEPRHAPAESKSDSADDDIAAMLLSLEDGDSPGSAGSGLDAVPDGSTVMDLRLPPELLDPGAAKPGQDPKQAAKGGTGDTRAAAARILDMMTKRPRT
jgi:predicted component of type VI protein secretion system